MAVALPSGEQLPEVWGPRCALIPVGLGGQREHGLGGAAACHEAAPAEVGAPASAAFPDQFLDGEGLDDRGRAQGALRLQVLLRSRVLTLCVPEESRVPWRLLGLADGQRGLRGASAEMGVLQRAHVLTDPRRSHRQAAVRPCSSAGQRWKSHSERKEIQPASLLPDLPPSSFDGHLSLSPIAIHIPFF